jgi:Fic family protein
LSQLLSNTAYCLENPVHSAEEIAVHFHHQLVWLHPFPNGNGRHSRLMTDCLLKQRGLEPFSWGRANLIAANAVRGRYLQALRAADGGDYQPLQIFVRS